MILKMLNMPHRFFLLLFIGISYNQSKVKNKLIGIFYDQKEVFT